MAASAQLSTEIDLPDFRALFECAPSCFLVLTPDLTIVAASDAYLAVSRTERDHIVGRGVFEVFTDNTGDPAASGAANLKTSLQRVLSSGRADTMAVQRYDLALSAEVGAGFEERHWSVINSPVPGPDGGIAYIVHRVEDVTEFVHTRVAAGAEPTFAGAAPVEVSTTELDVYLRAQEIQETNQHLRLLARSRSEFLSRMSHELRTPMNAVMGFAQLLGLEDLTDVQRGAVQHILQGGAHLLALVDEVLDMARAESGIVQLDLRAVRLDQVVDAAIAMTGPLANKLGISVSRAAIDPALVVTADRQRLLQILLNLLTNAIKYNRPAGTVVVTVVAEDQEGTTGVSITDTGLGIREQDFPRLFVEFDRLDADRSDIEGVGLGLALSRCLAEQMGGTIRVASVVGAGSTFSVHVPQDHVASRAPCLRS